MSTSMSPKSMDGFYVGFVFFPTSEHLEKNYLPDDHEKVYSSHSLKWRLGVKPPHIGPAGRSELEHGSFDLPSGGVDVPERRKQFCWKSREIRKGKKNQTTILTILQPVRRTKDPFLFEHLSNSGLCSQVRRWECHTWWGASARTGMMQRPGHSRAITGDSLWAGDKRCRGTLKTATWS